MIYKKVFDKFMWISVAIAVCCVYGNNAFYLNQTAEYCSSDEYSSTKLCFLRDRTFLQDQWNHWAGMLCYNYTNTLRLIYKYNLTAVSLYCPQSEKTQTVLGFIINSTTGQFGVFDYKHEESSSYLSLSFETELAYQNYLTCCTEAEECCANSMTNENIIHTKDHCPVVWDAWSCFPTTPVNSTATMPCSSQAYQSPDVVCTLESRKDCYWNQTLGLAVWNDKTDYSPCAIAPVYLRRYRFQVIFLHICNACTLPAIIIFVCFKTFRESTRVILHRNLLVALIVRNIFTIISKELVIIDALLSSNVSNHVMDRNTVGCRVLAFIASAATNSIYACMFVDGFYLHKVIVRTFAKDPKLIYLYSLVMVLTFVPSLIWASIVAVNQRSECWMVDRHNEQWAVDGFRIVILLTNFVLLLDIIRVMLSKMKQGGTTRQTKAAFRATLFLIPLFGLHIFITAKKIVINNTCLAEDIYDYFRYSMEALQGIAVAFLFCYANTEVHNEMKNAFRKLNIQLNQKYGWSFGEQKSRRRTTTATYVAASVSQESF